MPINHDASLRRHPPAQRRGAVPRPGGEVSSDTRPSATPTVTPGTSVTWKQAGDEVSRLAAGLLSLGHRARAARRHRVRHPLRVDPRRPGDHVRRRRDDHRLPVAPTPRTRRTSSATRSARWSSPRTTSRSRSCRPQGRAAARPKVVTFDGTTDGDWVITLDDLADARRRLPRRAPRRRRRDGRGRSRPTSSPR